MKTVHIVSVSGGMSSMAVYWQVKNQYPKDKVIAVFCDTIIEHYDLYRFLIEVIDKVKTNPKDTAKYLKIPVIQEIEKRKKYLFKLREFCQKAYPNFVWLSADKTPFDIFIKNRLMGNQRIDPCSKYLKREPFRKFVNNFDHKNTIIYLGLDHDEPKRISAFSELIKPYSCRFPLAENPSIFPDFLDWMNSKNIKRPLLYGLGFWHNNCGGFCVKAGHKQFKNLLEKMPEDYETFSEMEEDVYKKIGKKYPFIKKVKNGDASFLSMRDFKKESSPSDNVDDDSSCSCFL
jgi:hypothetical protein